MPLLNPQNQGVEITPLTRQVAQIETAPRRMIVQMVQQWEQAFDLLWGNRGGVTPSERLETLGTNGAELMQRSEALVTFLLTQLDGEDQALIDRIQAKVAAMPELTVGEDGTVTLA